MDIKELKENDLDKVSGGTAVTPLPAEGITFNTYVNLEPGYYYAEAMDFNTVVYLSSPKNYNEEYFIVDETNKTWRAFSKRTGTTSISSSEIFHERFPYKLNVRAR